MAAPNPSPGCRWLRIAGGDRRSRRPSPPICRRRELTRGIASSAPRGARLARCCWGTALAACALWGTHLPCRGSASGSARCRSSGTPPAAPPPAGGTACERDAGAVRAASRWLGALASSGCEMARAPTAGRPEPHLDGFAANYEQPGARRVVHGSDPRPGRALGQPCLPACRPSLRAPTPASSHHSPPRWKPTCRGLVGMPRAQRGWVARQDVSRVRLRWYSASVSDARSCARRLCKRAWGAAPWARENTPRAQQLTKGGADNAKKRGTMRTQLTPRLLAGHSLS